MKPRSLSCLFFFLLAIAMMVSFSFGQVDPETVVAPQQNGDDVSTVNIPPATSADQAPAPLEVWLDDLVDTPWDNSWSAYFKSIKKHPEGLGITNSWNHEIKGLSLTLQKNQDLIIHIKNVRGVTFFDNPMDLWQEGSLYAAEQVINWGDPDYWWHHILPLDLDQTQNFQSGRFYFKNYHEGKMQLTFLYTLISADSLTHEKLNRQVIDVTTE